MPSQEFPPVIKLLTFLISWQGMFHVSDSAMGVLLSFIRQFLRLLSNVARNQYIQSISDSVPKTYSGALKLLKVDSKDNFTMYVVCPKCNSIYSYNLCYEVKSGQKVSKHSQFIAFPNHPHATQRLPCGALLMKQVRNQNGKSIDLVPRKSYPYRYFFDAIKLSKPDFLNMCERWRKRSKSIPSGTLGDVYDGKVWRDFSDEEYGNFLKFPGNLLLSLNIDWFQPFTHTQYSVGAMYLVVLNLPREERYKIENVILIGVIPGPKTMNSYIAPMV